jgi:hypothetical protein
MEKTIEIGQSSPATRSTPMRQKIDRMNSTARQLTAPEIRLYIQNYLPSFPAKNYAGLKATTISADKIALLKSFEPIEVAIILQNASEKIRSIEVTAFNVTEVLKDKGYSVDYVAKTIDNGNSRLKGDDGTPFPLQNNEGYAKFTYRENILYMPVKNHLINTNYFSVSGLTNVLFNQQLAELSHIMSSLYYMSNGVVKTVLAPEAGMNLLNFAYYLNEAFENTNGGVTGYIGQWIAALPSPSSSGWATTTLHGQTFAHVFYMAVTNALRQPDYFDMVQEIIRCVFGNIINNQGEYQSVLDIDDDGVLVLNRRPLSLPSVLANQAMDLQQKEATLHQAYTALHLARSFRGENSGDRGSLSRMSYFPFMGTAKIADLSYFATNLARHIQGVQDLIVVTNNASAAGGVMQLLDALYMLNFKGRIFAQKMVSLVNILKVRDGDERDELTYYYGKAEFTVILSNDTRNYCSKLQWVYTNPMSGSILPGVGLISAKPTLKVDKKDETLSVEVERNVLVFDMRTNEMGAVSKTDISQRETICYKNFQYMVREWESWSWPVLSRTSMFRDLIGIENVEAVTGLELHNLVAWVGYRKQMYGDENAWWYNIDRLRVLDEICAASIITNFMRCMMPIVGYSPFVILRHYKYKVPVLKVFGLGKTQDNVPDFKIVSDIKAAASKGVGAFSDFLNASSFQVRAVAMKMVSSGEVKDVPSPILKSSGDSDLQRKKTFVFPQSPNMVDVSPVTVETDGDNNPNS